ncbi:hypothetical protein LHFGNBLO_000239 [Mesorhizobium sp. AR10]|nr:hypothetical protein LHFGNBLO_000239 [Mesorhizobium sp. AR10]
MALPRGSFFVVRPPRKEDIAGRSVLASMTSRRYASVRAVKKICRIKKLTFTQTSIFAIPASTLARLP